MIAANISSTFAKCKDSPKCRVHAVSLDHNSNSMTVMTNLSENTQTETQNLLTFHKHCN